jgi:hypothetical protein
MSEYPFIFTETTVLKKKIPYVTIYRGLPYVTIYRSLNIDLPVNSANSVPIDLSLWETFTLMTSFSFLVPAFHFGQWEGETFFNKTFSSQNGHKKGEYRAIIP